MFIKSITTWIAAFAIAVIGLPFAALSQQTQRPYRISDRQVEQIIRRIEQRTDVFRRNLDRALDKSRLDGTMREDNINVFVQDFEQMTDRLRERFNNHQSVAADVEAVLNSSVRINRFMQNNNLNRAAENSWTSLRRDLDQLALTYSVAWNWSRVYNPNLAVELPYRVNDKQVDNLLRRVDTRSEHFKRSLDRALDESRFDNTRREDEINRFITNFNNDAERLRERFNGRNSVAADVERVLTSAARINEFMRRHALNRTAQSDWSLLRGDLEELAKVYNVSWNWYTLSPNAGTLAGNYIGDALLTGTFRINVSRSDDTRTVANRLTPGLSQLNRARVENLINTRFAPAEIIAIERRGTGITMETNRTPTTIWFRANGQMSYEPYPEGTNRYLRTEIKGERLTLSTVGTRDGDFRVTFTPVSNGQMLVVTRFIYSDILKQPAIVQTYYNRVSDTAQWGVYNNNNSSSSMPER